MQINFEGDQNSFIFILDPRQLDQKTKHFFNKNIMANKNIIKILHGADSLDIPYTYSELLHDKKLIIDFTMELIDTKYLCEYYNITHDGKCKIYDVLKSMNVITNKKYIELNENDQKMGPIYDIYINIKNMNENLLLYTLYDVIYLKYLYQSYLKIDKKIYGNIVPEFTRYVYLEKREIIDVVRSEKNKIDSMNNYMIYIDKTNKRRLNEVFIGIMSLIKSNIIHNILKLNYFRANLILLFKFITYSIIIDKHQIYETTDNIFNGKLSFSELRKKLADFKCLISIINDFKDEVIKLI